MTAQRKFVKDILIFALSSFGSRAITILLLPLYSYSLQLEEYGELDVLLTLVMLFMPLLTFSMYESILKMCIEKRVSRKVVFSSSIFLLAILTIIAFILVCFVNSVFFKYERIFIFFGVILSISIYEYFSKFSKGVGQQFVFAISNIIIAAVMLFLNILLVYYYEAGIDGVLYSHMISYLIGSVFIFFRLSMWRFISKRYTNVEVIKKMLTISVPLIPNAAMWWMFNASDRSLVYHFSGADQAGLYGVGNKLSVIIMIVNAVVFQAWQIATLREKGKDTQNQFFTDVIRKYIYFIFFVSSFLISINQFLLETILSEEFSNAWRVGNILILSTTFYSLASFLGVFYVVFEKTKRAFATSSFTAILNLILNLVLIPTYGIYGAAFATLASTVLIFIVRMLDTSNLASFKFSYTQIITLIVSIFLQLFFVYQGEYIFSYVITAIIFSGFLFDMRSFLLRQVR
ncbi:lipopolysaccharide biosynthesis protein [Vibrio natriegens]|uniref:lipopolysaccharide biosynthesis protein n=1 Tax=Vibrio natriegens TaxID=691 RepID=UPI00080425AA|nr:polysaccharide biosynthesis C-terminal domain-containing protein [Vibrio natriegens]ANQ15899.1 hypothetical protein BA891_01080 [Vibrio natriegens]